MTRDRPTSLEGKPRRRDVEAILARLDLNLTPDPVSAESIRVHRTLKGPHTPGSWPDAFDLSLLNEKAVLTIRETQESWRRWCDLWDEALASVSGLRVVP